MSATVEPFTGVSIKTLPFGSLLLGAEEEEEEEEQATRIGPECLLCDPVKLLEDDDPTMLELHCPQIPHKNGHNMRKYQFPDKQFNLSHHNYHKVKFFLLFNTEERKQRKTE